jgi:hypothetical protein
MSNFQTDRSDVASMNRNNCRGGDDKNCMYYNGGGPGQSHYNYVAVQGAGAPESPLYTCASKAFDYYNDNNMYGDHALGGLGTHTEDYGEANLAGQVKFRDSECSECMYGKRDMCDKCHVDQPDFAGANGDPMPYLRRVTGGATILGFPRHLVLLALAVAGFWGVKTGRVNIKKRSTQMMLVALAAVLFFF